MKFKQKKDERKQRTMLIENWRARENDEYLATRHMQNKTNACTRQKYVSKKGNAREQEKFKQSDNRLV